MESSFLIESAVKSSNAEIAFAFHADLTNLFYMSSAADWETDQWLNSFLHVSFPPRRLPFIVDDGLRCSPERMASPIGSERRIPHQQRFPLGGSDGE